MQHLTKAEEQIMKKLWQLKKARVKDVIELMEAPKPAYNTVSTIIRILEKKEIVSHEKHGKSYYYFPLLKEEDYKKQSLQSLISSYFGGSFKQMASFFAKEENISVEEFDEILKEVKKDIKD